jgi:predicted nuclease of predicted toxin-antitoxin system
MIIADENIDQEIIRDLEDKGYSVYSIRANTPGISDKEIIRMLNNRNAILITEDKDFGELVFSYGFQEVKIIFLRYRKSDLLRITTNLEKTLNDYLDKTGNYFITITPKKIRIQNL